jgi:ATP phosphoribosyltransferase
VARGASLPLRIGYSGGVLSYTPQGNGNKQVGSSAQNRGEGRGHGLQHPYLESYEFGAEIVGSVAADHELETVGLALGAAARFGYGSCVLVLGHTLIRDELVLWGESQELSRESVVRLLKQGNLAALQSFTGFDQALRSGLESCGIEAAAQELRSRHPGVRVVVDPYLVRPQGFYSGITFEIHALYGDERGSQRLVRVGAGGRYDGMFGHYGLDVSAMGFKICDPVVIGAELRERSLPVVAQAQKNASSTNATTTAARPALSKSSTPIKIAVPKGRLLGPIIDAFGRLGIHPEVDPRSSRKLVIRSLCGGFEFLIVKNSDVPAYVGRSMADVGVVGSDVLDESGCEVVRPITFVFGKTRVCLAGDAASEARLRGNNPLLRAPVIATKYPLIAARELGARAIDCDLVHLNGSVELASVIGFADAIVDLVETGATLAQNGLVVFEELCTTSVHLCVSEGMRYLNADTIDRWQKVWEEQDLIVSARRVK